MQTTLHEDHHRDPWELLHQELPEVRVAYRWLRPGVMGYTEWPDNGNPHIVIAEGIDAIERRVTLAHEAHHVLRGAPPPGLEDDEELVVRHMTARWLLPDAHLVGHAIRRHRLDKAAAKLEVTSDVLLDRVRWASQDELDVIADWRPAPELRRGQRR